MTEFISLDASIDLSKWDSSIAQMISDANKIESILKGFSAVSIRVDVDDAALVDAVGLVDRLNAQSANVRIDALVDDEFRNAAELIDRIDSEKATVQIDATVDREFQNAAKLIDRIDNEKANVTISATDNASTEIGNIEEKLQNLQNLATISLVLDAAGFLQTFNSLPIVSTMLDVETQTQRVIGSINRDLPNAGDIINEVFTNNWGSSREEVANVIITLAQLKDETGDFIVAADELGTVAQSAFAAAQLAGGDLEMTIQAASALVRNDFVGSYEEAFDFIAEGSKRGLGLQGDFLDTINEYSSTFESLGISAEGFFNMMESGANAGVFNMDKVGDSFKEMMNLTKEEVQIKVAVGDETDRTKALTEIGLFDEGEAYAAGQISGDEFAQGVLDALNAIEDPAEQQRLAKAIFSPTMIEDAGLDNILAIALESPENVGAWEGSATEGANIINDTLESALSEAVKTFETEMSDSLKTLLIDSGFLEQIENAAMTFADTIQGGGTMGEAIELSLGLEEGSVARFESIIGNFVIAAGQFLAGAIDLLGGDSSGVRANLVQASEQQLAFDIQLAEDGEAVARAFETAVARGVSSPDAQAAVSQAVDEMLAAGDIAGAQQVVENLGNVVDTNAIKDGLSAAGANIIEGARSTEHAVTRLQEASTAIGVSPERAAALQADIALLTAAPTVDTSGLQAQVDTFVADLHSGLTAAINAQDWSGALDIANKLGLDNAEQLVSDLHLSSQLQAIEIPAQVAFDPTTFDQNMQGMTDQILVELNGAESAITDKQVTVSNVSMRIVDDVGTAEETVTSSIPTFTAAETQITGTGVEVTAVSMRIVDAGIVAAEGTQDASKDMSTAWGETAAASGQLNTATLNYNALASAIGSSAPGLVSQLEQIVNALSAFAGAGSKALQVSDGLQTVGSTGVGESGSTAGSKGNIGHAAGGFKPEGMGGWVGEEGPEYQVAGQDVSILNNQTSEALWTAMQSMGMRGGGSNTTYNYNINVINNNASGAAHYGAMQGFANKIRGQ